MAEQPTTDAVEILRRHFVAGSAEMEAELVDVRLSLSVAQQIYDLRTAANLTQRELAEKVGTTASVICRLEDADYDGKQSVRLLSRIAAALEQRVEIRFVPLTPKKKRKRKVKG